MRQFMILILMAAMVGSALANNDVSIISEKYRDGDLWRENVTIIETTFNDTTLSENKTMWQYNYTWPFSWGWQRHAWHLD